METTDLRDTVASARQGSEQAYRELVGRFGPGLLGYFARNTGNQADAEDLLQDVFVRLVKAFPAYREKERFEVWLYRMARHLLIDYWRKRKVSLAAEDWMIEEQITADPLDRMTDRETQDELQRALAKLSPEQREVILMRYFSDLTFEEIAKANATPLGTALARAHRGLARLKELLTQKEKVS